MDIEKIREFRAWWLDDQQAELRASCAEGWGLTIWKAARESLVIELPEAHEEYHPFAGDLDEPPIVFCAYSVRAAIEAAGLKVKP